MGQPALPAQRLQRLHAVAHAAGLDVGRLAHASRRGQLRRDARRALHELRRRGGPRLRERLPLRRRGQEGARGIHRVLGQRRWWLV